MSVALFGCSQSALRVRVPDTVQSVIFGVDDEEPGLEARHVSGPLEVVLNVDDTMFGVGFSDSLDQLGLSEGPLEVGRCDRSCRLLEPELVVQVAEAGSAEVSVESADGLLRRLVPDSAARCDQCSSFEKREVEYSPRVGLSIYAAARLPNGSLAVASDQAMYLLKPDLEVEELCTTAKPYFEAVAIGGSIWASDGRALVELDPEQQDGGPCRTRTATVIAEPPLRDLAGGKTPGGLELFYLDHEGQLIRFDGARSARLGQLPVLNGRILWGGPGELLVALKNGVIKRWTADLLVDDQPPELPADVEIDGGDFSNELGFVLPYHDQADFSHPLGLAMSRRFGEWSLFRYDGLHPTQATISAPPGILTVQRGGTFQRMNPITGEVCEREEGFFNDTPHHLIELTEGRIAVPDIVEAENRPGLLGVLSRPGARCR